MFPQEAGLSCTLWLNSLWLGKLLSYQRAVVAQTDMVLGFKVNKPVICESYNFTCYTSSYYCIKWTPDRGDSKAYSPHVVPGNLDMSPPQGVSPWSCCHPGNLRLLSGIRIGRQRNKCKHDSVFYWVNKIIPIKYKVFNQNVNAMKICLSGMQNRSCSPSSSAPLPPHWDELCHISKGWHLPESLAAREPSPKSLLVAEQEDRWTSSLFLRLTRGCRLRKRHQLSRQVKAMQPCSVFVLQKHWVNMKICFWYTSREMGDWKVKSREQYLKFY